MTVQQALNELVILDRQITDWVKALPVVSLGNFKRIKDKRSRVIASIQAMGYQPK